MGSAQSARRTQPGGGSAARAGDGGRCVASAAPALAPARRAALCPRRAHFLRWRCVATGSGSAWKGSARRWVDGFIPSDLYSAHRPDLAVSPRGRGKVSQRRDPHSGGWVTGPPASGATVDLDGLPPVRPDRVAPPGRGPALAIGARGLRRCRLPTRPVLKHGPRSLTRARVRGLGSNPRGAMKVKGGSSPPQVGSRRRRAPGAPPARLARPVGEVEHERAR